MGGGIARGLAHLAHNSVHVKNVFKFMDAKRENGTGTERVAQRESFTNLNMERCVRSMHARTNTHARTLARPHEHTKKKNNAGRTNNRFILFHFFCCVCVCAGNIAYSAPDLQSVCVCVRRAVLFGPSELLHATRWQFHLCIESRTLYGCECVACYFVCGARFSI